jgi:PIN like domain
MVKPIRQRDTGALARMPVSIHGDRDARMPQLLRDILNGGMMLIELDGRIAVPQIVDTIDTQARQGTDVDALRRGHRIAMYKIREALSYLEAHFPSPHPLANQKFETDGIDLFIFSLDRSLGKHIVADALRQAGAAVEMHNDHFRQDASDVEWLRAVGPRG